MHDHLEAPGRQVGTPWFLEGKGLLFATALSAVPSPQPSLPSRFYLRYTNSGHQPVLSMLLLMMASGSSRTLDRCLPRPPSHAAPWI